MTSTIHPARGGARPGTGPKARFRGKSAVLVMRVLPETRAALEQLAAAEAISLADAFELVARGARTLTIGAVR